MSGICGEKMASDLHWELDHSQEITQLQLSGSITERSDFDALLGRIPGDVVLNLKGISKINSLGIREWIRFVDQLGRGRNVTLEECSTPLVRQFNMISNMAGNAKIVSIMLPYFCSACEHEQELSYSLRDREEHEIPEEITCESCSETSEFDDLSDTYLAFTRRVNLRVQ